MSTPKNQGEGDRESARRFNEDEHKFVQSGKVKNPTPSNEKEARELEQAEQKAKARGKK